MPLLDHFHSPGKEDAPWESIGSGWIYNVMESLNRILPASGYRAFMQIPLGQFAETDVAEYQESNADHFDSGGMNGGLQTAVRPAPALTIEPNFPDEFEVQIKTTRDGRKLVAVIEFVSPSNKDREEARAKFLSKSLGYLQLGVGLVIVDTIANRHNNFHNELMAMISGVNVRRMTDTPIYISVYEPSGYESVTSLDIWPYTLGIGQVIPSVPLPIPNGPDVMIDLETAYMKSLAAHNIHP